MTRAAVAARHQVMPAKLDSHNPRTKPHRRRLQPLAGQLPPPTLSREFANRPAMPDYHLFLSYCREDNKQPVNETGEGWVTAFEREIKERHRRYSGRELQIFFDQKAIDTARDWRRELGAGLRSSRLFLAFLTPNYLTSPNCLWEWDEYLRREHSAARGDDGLTPIYFVTPADLRPQQDQAIAEWLQGVAKRYPWFSPASRRLDETGEHRARSFLTDLHRRNKTPLCELQPWIEQGPQMLRELDAAARSLDAKNAPRDPAADLRTLAQRLDGLDRHIARRLDRIALADLAPGNLSRSHEHFVGRHRELRELHDIMVQGGPQSGGHGTGGLGMIAATFSPGGLGKTALARQYGHAYAEFFAAGGVWEIPCEGVSQMGAALLRLADDRKFQRLGDDLGQPLQLTEDERKDFPSAAAAVFTHLHDVTQSRVAVLHENLLRQHDLHSPAHDLPEIEQPRALLILDNVDRPELLSAREISRLPAGNWLEIIVTTRLNPSAFGCGDRTLAYLEIGTLPPADALQLLADFQPAHRFASADEEAAAREIVAALGGWTLAVELVAAYVGDLAKKHEPNPFRRFLNEMQTHGLAWVDNLADKDAVDDQLRHSRDADAQRRKRENRIGTLVRWSVERLSPAARTALEFASLLMPDEIPLEWLRVLTTQRHPTVADETTFDNPDAWPRLWAELRGLRLLHPAGEVQYDDRGLEQIPVVARIHRLVAEHVAHAGLPEHVGEVEQLVVALATELEHNFGRVDATTDAFLRARQPWLRDQLDFLITARESTRLLHAAAQVAADFEAQHGSLVRALDLTSRILAAQEKLHAAALDAPDLARDVSVSLEKLAGLLARRGQPGDAEQALGHYQRSLEIRERMLTANPESAQAARDVSVSLEKLADFLSSRGQPGDVERALGHYQRSLEIRERMLTANPESAQAARDVSVSLERLADFLSRRGQPGDAEQALGHYQRSLEISERLLTANPESAQAARGVSIRLNKLADLLSARGQPGDAEQALGHLQRSLEISERLLTANPESAQAARDVLVALERLAAIEAARQDGEKKALELQMRSLEIALQLRERNPTSLFYQRTAAVAFFLGYQRAQSAKNEDLAAQCLLGCFSVLDPLVQAGVELDPPMRQLHAQLQPLFSPS